MLCHVNVTIVHFTQLAVEQLNQHGCHGNHSQSSGYHPLGCFKYGYSDIFTNPKVFNFQVVFGVRFDLYIHYMKTLTPGTGGFSRQLEHRQSIFFPQDFRAAAVVQFGGQLQLSSGSDELPENGNAMVYPDSSSWLQ